MREDGDLVHVTLDASVRAKVQAILAATSAADPERQAVYTWWQQHIDRPERHHMWPKWLLGDEAQVGMMLPRCIHNMAGVGLDDGGFHQVLNRLFSEDPQFEKLRVEDKTSFIRLFRNARSDAQRRQLLYAIRGLLQKAYQTVLGDQALLARVGARLTQEMDSISMEVKR